MIAKLANERRHRTVRLRRVNTTGIIGLVSSDADETMLGALIGAGGYGPPILTGVRHCDMRLILEGACSAAILALVAQSLLDVVERLVVPRGVRLTWPLWTTARGSGPLDCCSASETSK